MIGNRQVSCHRRLLASTVLASIVAVCAPTLASAQEDAGLAALEAQVAALMDEIQSMKAQQARMAAAMQQAEAAPPPPSGAQSAVIAETTGIPIALQSSLQTPPSPGIAGHPFYGALPEGRTTGAMATGNDKVTLTFSGQINRALNTIDDGLSTDLYQVDNENASSRFRFLGQTSPLNDTIAVSALEFEWPVNGSLDVSQLEQSVTDQLNRGLNLRLLEVGFGNDNYGSFFIGQGWMASDGTSEIDISGITTPLWVGQTFAFGGMLPTQDQGDTDYIPKNVAPDPADYATEDEYDAAFGQFASAASNFVNVFQLGNGLDGLSRLVRVRYNTPVFGGFQLSASAGTSDRYDVALRYAGETDMAKFAAAASYWTDSSDTGYDGITGSASMLLTGGDVWWDGLSLTVSAAQQKFEQSDNEPLTYFGKVAYQKNWWEVGRTAFALAYGHYEDFYTQDEDFYTQDTESNLYGIAVSQNVDRLGSEFYAGLTQSDFSIPDYDVNDMTVLQLGAMVRF